MTVQSEYPTLTVVVVSFRTWRHLDRCLKGLTLQADGQSIEILVVRAEHAGDASGIRSRAALPPVQWIWAPAGSTVPQLRSLGYRHSRAAIVAFVEDDCVVTDTWCAAVIDAHRSPFTAIGGAVEPAGYTRGVDWAAYFCDYVRFMRPFAGVVEALPGNNVSYKRLALAGTLGPDDIAAGFYEVFVHETLQRTGQPLWAHPEMVVSLRHSWTRSDLIRTPYHHGRGFGSMRTRDWPLARRVLLASVVTLLPILQCGRITAQVRQRGRHRARLVQALPWIVVHSVSWSAGEIMGYLAGAGNSLQKWR